MNGVQAERLIRTYLLPHLAGFRVRRGLLFAVPIGDLLQGILLEPSGFEPSAFYLSVVVQPLYIPETDLVLNFSERLGCGWDLADGEAAVLGRALVTIRREGLPFLARLSTPAALADNAIALTGAPDHVHVLEAVAYSLILAARRGDAVGALDRVEAALAREAPLPWVRELAARARLIRAALHGQHNDALALLATWRQQTIAHLRLEEQPRRRRAP